MEDARVIPKIYYTLERHGFVAGISRSEVERCRFLDIARKKHKSETANEKKKEGSGREE